jgi:thioredoxin 2
MATDPQAAALPSETIDKFIFLPCGVCGAKNPTSGSELSEARSCSSCQAALGPLAAPVDVDANELAAVVSSARVPVLVDFWAPWCPPCRLAGPIVKKVAADLKGNAIVLKVDIDRHPALAAELAVRAIPTFFVIRNQKIVKQEQGLATPGTIKRWLASK